VDQTELARQVNAGQRCNRTDQLYEIK
jgi:hypothetical protein